MYANAQTYTIFLLWNLDLWPKSDKLIDIQTQQVRSQKTVKYI